MKNLILTISFIIATFQFANSDTEIKYNSTIELENGTSIKHEVRNCIREDRSYNANKFKMDMSKLSQSGTAFDIIANNIIRLDKGVRWSAINSKSKTYDETSLSSLHNIKPLAEANDYAWTYSIIPYDSLLEVKNVKCHGFLGKAVGVKKTWLPDSAFITFECWIADDTLISLEVLNYLQNYSKVAGANRIWTEEFMSTYFELLYPEQLEQMSNLMGDKKGITMKTSIIVEKTRTINEFSKDGGYLRIIKYSNEIVSFKKKPFDDKMFEIPEGFEKKQFDVRTLEIPEGFEKK